MTEYKIVKQLINTFGNSNTEILEIFKTGSQIFINTPTDLDYVAICSNYPGVRTKHFVIDNNLKYDILLIDNQVLTSILDFTDTITISPKVKLFNYFFNLRNVVYGKYDLNWNMLEHKIEYMDYIKERYINSIGKLKIKTKFTKLFTHYYVILKIFENNKIEITPKMHEDITKIYQGGEQILPIIEWIENKLNIK